MPTISEDPATSTPTVAVTAQLMQSFELEVPVVAGNSFAVTPFPGSENQIQLFFIGSSGSLYRVYPSSNNTTGWACDPVTGSGATGLSKIVFGGGYGPGGGTVRLYALSKEGAPSSLTISGSQVQATVTFTSSGAIPNFSDIRYSQNALAVACVTKTGQCCLLDDFNKSSIIPIFANTTAPVSDFCSAYFMTTNTAGEACAAIVSSGTGSQSQITIGGWYPQNNAVQAPLAEPTITQQYQIATFATVQHMPFTADTFGSDTVVFGLTASGTQLVQYVNSQRGGVLTPSVVSLSQPLTDISACYNYNTRTVDVFGLGSDHFIYHLGQSQTDSVWSGQACIDNSQTYIAIQATYSPSGSPQLGAVTQAGDVFLVVQDPTSTDWSITELNIPPSSPQSAPGNDLQAVPIYSTSIVVTNPDGTPYSLQAATIASDSPATIQVNGNYAYVDPTAPLSAQTDLQGRIQILQPVASLSSPVLCVTFPFTPPNAGIVVDPSATIQQALATVTADQLMVSNNCIIDNHGNTGPLLPAGTSASDVAEAVQALNSATTMVEPWNKPSPASFAFAKRTDPRVASYLEGIQPKAFSTPRGRVRPNGKWSIERTANGLKYSSGDSVVLPPSDAFLGLNVSWGDIVDAVKEGVYEVTKVAVDGVNAAINLVINGVVQPAINAVVDTVAQVFDLVEMVFGWIGAKFEQLFQWLAFIFNFDDIKAVAAIVETAVTQVLTFVPQALKLLAAKKLNLTHYESLVQQYTSEAFQNIPGADQTGASLYASLDADSNTGSNTAQLADDHSIARTGFLNNAPGASTSIPTSASPSSNMKNLNTQIGNLYSQLQPTPGFAQWTGSADSWQTTSGITGSSVSQTFASAEPLANSAVGPLLGMIETAIDAAADALDSFTSNYLTAGWNIPFVSQFYKEVVGSDLTTVGLISLLVAVPTTMTIKLICPEAFADLSWQQEFAQSCTAANLLKSCGLLSSVDAVEAQAKGVVGDSNSPAWQNIVGYFCGYLQGFLSMGAAFLEPFVDLYLNPKQALSQPGQGNVNSFAQKIPGNSWDSINGINPNVWNPLFSFSVALCAINLANVVLNCPFLVETHGADEPWKWNSFGYSNWLWIASFAVPIVDIISMVAEHVSARVSSDVFSFIYSLLGVGQFAAIIVMNADFKSDPQQPNGWAFASMYAGCIPQIDKFMHITSLIEATDGWSYILLPIIDGTVNKITAILNFIAAETNNPFSQATARAAAITS
jgi:hypothetical protein